MNFAAKLLLLCGGAPDGEIFQRAAAGVHHRDDRSGQCLAERQGRRHR